MTKIMLFEDDITMRTLLKTLFGIEGYEVAAYGEVDEVEAINLLRNEKPTALLCDVRLQKTNGLNILRRIRQDDELKTLKVLMTSGLDAHEECEKNGADGFIQKPYAPDDLISWFRNIE